MKGFLFHLYSALMNRVDMASGRIETLDERTGSDGQKYFYPIVNFETSDGKVFRVRSRTAYQDDRSLQIASAVNVYFPAGRPAQARLETLSWIALVPDVLFFIAALACLLVIWVLARQ